MKTGPKLTMYDHSNQTNLAIKGIIALQAMSEVATRAGYEDESSNYSTLAKEYLEFWTDHGVNAEAGHSMLQYDNKDSYGTRTAHSSIVTRAS